MRITLKGFFVTAVELVVIFSVLGSRQNVLKAQGTAGVISGTAKDETGAIVPGVTVTVTHVGTGTVRTAITGDTGEYRIPALAIGTYNLEAELPGFKKVSRSGVTLQVGQEAVVSFTLQVGDSNQEVLVTDAVPLIGAFLVRECGVQNGYFFAENLMKIGRDGGSEANLGHQQDGRASSLPTRHRRAPCCCPR